MISNTIGYGGVSWNSDLKGENYGRVGSNWFCSGSGRTHSIYSTRKTYKDFKRKGDSRRRLQGRVKHCSNSISHCRGSLNRDGGAVLNRTLVTPYLRLWLVGVELFGSVKNG